MNSSTPTSVQHDVDRKMTKPIVIQASRWWQLWRKPTVINMQLLARQVDLADEEQQLVERRCCLVRELNEYNKHVVTSSRSEAKWKKVLRTVEWAAQPKSQYQPRLIPGIGLELSLVGLHLVIVIATLVV